MQQSIKNTCPPDPTAATSMFLVNLNIIEQQHVAGVKSPLLRIIDNSRRVVEDKLKTSSVTDHKIFTELEFKKLITTISVTGRRVPFVGTGRVALTVKIRKF